MRKKTIYAGIIGLIVLLGPCGCTTNQNNTHQDRNPQALYKDNRLAEVFRRRNLEEPEIEWLNDKNYAPAEFGEFYEEGLIKRLIEK